MVGRETMPLGQALAACRALHPSLYTPRSRKLNYGTGLVTPFVAGECGGKEPINWPSQTRPWGQRPRLAAEPIWPSAPTSTKYDPQAFANVCARSNETRSSLRLARTMEGKGSDCSSIGPK